MKRKPNRDQRAHDRRSAIIPYNAHVRTKVVDDPYELGGKITVLASTRHDPLEHMHARGEVDEAHYAACREYQRLCERAELVPVKAMDPTKEPVDGGGAVPDPFTDAKRKAIRRLIHLHKTLGPDGANLIRRVLVFNISIRKYALFRTCADCLAIEMGFAPRKRMA